jgi:NAD(P)H dehydrogenase (quinone)
VPERIAVSGAGGALGRLVAELLLEVPGPESIVLATRTPDALADLAARGARVRFADFRRPESLARAYRGCGRLLLISAETATGDRVALHAGAIRAAAAAGVRHIIFTSMPRVDDPGHPIVGPAHEYLATERLVAGSGLDWTVLRNGPYAELNLVERIGDSVVGGSIVTNSGSGGMSFVSRADCAAVAHAVLTGAGHAGRTYDITGPAALSYGEVAAMISKVVGRPVACLEIDDAAMERRLIDGGETAEMARLRVAMGIAIRDGFFAAVSPVAEQLCGRPPVAIADVLAGHREELARIFAEPPRLSGPDDSL